MPTTFRKTALGVQEIDQRAGRIPPRARSALILVDGRRNEEELHKLIVQADETLGLLLSAGMIERAADATPVAVPAAVPPAADLATRRRDAVRALNDLLGPAGETLALRLEKADDERALREQLERAVTMIASLRGQAEAGRFARRFVAQ